MSVPTFSLCYTTARPSMVPRVMKVWNERSTFKQHDWIISVDEGQPEPVLATLRGLDCTICVNNGSKDAVTGWNVAAAASTGKVLIAVADDFVPPPGWDAALLALKPESWIDGEYVVHVEDGFVGHLLTLAILTRKRYDRFGYLWYPAYQSMFCDTEFGTVAQRDGVVIEARHLLFEHLHPGCGKRQRDMIDLNHENPVRWKRGEMLYNYRKSQGFPVDAGPRATSERVPEAERRYAVYLQITRDDLCLVAVCLRLRDEGVNDFFFCVPDQYWDGHALASSDRVELKAAAESLRDAGLNVRVKIFKVASYRFAGDTRISTETRLRNDSLAWIRAEGFQHILIVDGDELWMPGTLHLVDQAVSAGHMAIATNMVPVIGLPGYPVDKATDMALVYIGGSCQFKLCREPFVNVVLIPQPRIIHFTGTRRTMDETVAKHRASGHYGDQAYDFEGWLEHVLPNIKPGFTYHWPNGTVGVHMYQPYNPWPLVRDWRPEEWAQIPDAVKNYLGPHLPGEK